jgi:hypothetical protein
MQTIGPGGTPIAPGSAGTLGGGTVGSVGEPSTRSTSNCVPDTTGASSGRSGTTAGLGPQPTIIAPEPGRPPEVGTTAPSAAGVGSLPPC